MFLRQYRFILRITPRKGVSGQLPGGQDQNQSPMATGTEMARRRFSPEARLRRRTRTTNPEIRDFQDGLKCLALQAPVVRLLDRLPRSEERRVGKECRSRWAP